jgi:hypothetical protein
MEVDTSGGNPFPGISSTGGWDFATEAGNTFANWISNPDFGLDPADQKPGDDPDGDGIDNGVESFFGTHPGVFSRGLLAGTRMGNLFPFTHPRNPGPAAGLGAAYRWSTDLAAFHADGASSGGTTIRFTARPDTPVAGTTTVTATATGTVPDRLFVDIMVTVP